MLLSFPDKNCLLTVLQMSPCHSVVLTSFSCYDFESLMALLLVWSISGYAVACFLCGFFRCRSFSASGLGLRIKVGYGIQEALQLTLKKKKQTNNNINNNITLPGRTTLQELRRINLTSKGELPSCGTRLTSINAI